jgi:hypothetical protein
MVEMAKTRAQIRLLKWAMEMAPGYVLPSNIYLADGKWIAAHMFTITCWKD